MFFSHGFVLYKGHPDMVYNRNSTNYTFIYIIFKTTIVKMCNLKFVYNLQVPIPNMRLFRERKTNPAYNSLYENWLLKFLFCLIIIRIKRVHVFISNA